MYLKKIKKKKKKEFDKPKKPIKLNLIHTNNIVMSDRFELDEGRG